MCQITVVVITPVRPSRKKGFGLCGAAFKCGDTRALTDASWWYNWHTEFLKIDQRNCSQSYVGEYVPMVSHEDNLKQKIPQEAKYVLGFNEPNEPNKANLTPERTAELWGQLEKKASGKILVGPALAGCDIFPGKCIDWFDRFFNACKNCRVDKIAVHGYHCVPHKMMESLGMISSRYNRPIWLTEFSCRGNVSVQQDVQFIHQIVPLLEKAPFIERYAWFCTRRKKTTPFLPNFSTNLLKMDEPSLTQVGHAYNTVM